MKRDYPNTVSPLQEETGDCTVPSKSSAMNDDNVMQ